MKGVCLLVGLAGCASPLASPFLPDATPGVCEPPIDGGADCPVPSFFSGESFGFSNDRAVVDRAQTGALVIRLPVCSTNHRLSLELYPGFGVFAAGLHRLDSYPLTGDDLDYQTCGACVRLLADADSEGRGSRVFMATGGTLSFSLVGDDFTASLKGVELREVAIDPVTFATRPVGSCVTEITSVDVKAAVSPPR
jgi:hypothetical protein